MLENRSFDHMFGFLGTPGIDGIAPQTKFNVDPIDGVPVYAQPVNPPIYQLSSGDKDPGHELFNTFRQLTGQKIADNTFPLSGYQNVSINNQGFVMDYALYTKSANPEKIMYCFSPEQIPVITTLAKNFAVCDCWYSSMPGPTLPNRFFVHAGTSGGLDENQGLLSEVGEIFRPITFTHGTIFNRIEQMTTIAGNEDMEWHLYKDGPLALSLLLDDVRKSPSQIHDLSQLENNLKSYTNKRTYNFIEPRYGIIDNYRTGNSEHPLGNICEGENLIKNVFETIRANDDIWKNSLLIIVYDEHGGFYDHVSPPTAVPTNDISPELKNKFGFKFDRYGVRVPTVIISPWIKPGIVIKEVGTQPNQLKKHYDHTSIIRSLSELWGINSLTPRDANAQSFLHIIGDQFRDVPKDLLQHNVIAQPVSGSEVATVASVRQPDDDEPVDAMLSAFMRIAIMNDLEKQEVKAEQWPANAAEQLIGITTKLQARQFLQFLQDKNDIATA